MAPRARHRDGIELQIAEASNDRVARAALFTTGTGGKRGPLGFQQPGPCERQPARFDERDRLGNRGPPEAGLEGNDGVGNSRSLVNLLVTAKDALR